MADEVVHTDAAEQERFLSLPLGKKLLEIHINGRETNGSVAEALRRIAKLEGLAVVHEGRMDTHEGRMEAVEHWQIKAAAIIGAAIFAGPGFFFLLGKAWGE